MVKITLCFFGALLICQPRVSASEYYWLDTDIGGDIDDLFALNMLASATSIKLLGVSTVNHSPVQKARIAKLALKHLSDQMRSQHKFRPFLAQKMASIKVHAGIGGEYKTNEEFLSYNPGWPKAMFGVPVPNEQWKRPLYSKQAQAYGDLLDDMDPDTTDVDSMLEAMAQAVQHAKRHRKKLNLVSIGPLGNIAAFIESFPDLVPFIRVWHMGGWFANNDGSLLRSGYNSGINPRASQVVFSSEAQVFIVSSDIVQRTRIEIDKETTWRSLTTIDEGKDSDWVKAIKQDWINWSAAFPRIHFADVLTTYLALHPQRVSKWQQYDIQYQVHEDHSTYGDKGFMNSDKPILEVEPSEDGNVYVVMEYSRPEKALQSILGVVQRVLKQK